MGIATTSYANTFALKLDGFDCGFVRSVDGGAVTADVIQESVGHSHFSQKHLGPPKYEELILKIGPSMNRAIYDWIAVSWQQKDMTKSGSVVQYDYKLEARGEREFVNALITETTIPAMDASAKDPAYFTVRIQPEVMRFNKGSGKPIAVSPNPKVEAKLLPSNFRLEIAGLDCTKVFKVDAFTVKRNIHKASIGDTRGVEIIPTTVEFPNLKISIAEASAQTWIDWHEDFVIRGNNNESKERAGSLLFVSPNATEIGRINFSNLGIFKLALDTRDSNVEEISRVTAELYCERMEFQYAAKA